jgi:hypothetical protein
LGGDQWGFQLHDADWAADLQDRRVKPSIHWSRASLCVDFNKFRTEVAEKGNKVRKIEVGQILEWAILGSIDGQSTDPRPANYIYPLLVARENPGRFIRLARLWDLVQKDLSESEYEELLEPVLVQHSMSPSDRASVLRPLAQFMKVVENIKTNSFVHALQIESFELTPQWSKDDYSDAIVTIFTRLNTAGRTLTREEITLAWLKVGWVLSQTDGKTAGECLVALQLSLEAKGFKLDTDDIVRLISFVWAVEHRKGVLLDSKDLLKGEVVRSMAGAVSAAWNLLMARIDAASSVLSDRDLIDNHDSFNAVIVFFTWYKLVFDRLDELTSVQLLEKDNLEKELKRRSELFLDRWLFGSQWANVWGDGAVRNFQDFATDLRDLAGSLKTSSASTLLAIVDAGVQQLMGRVVPKALLTVANIEVQDRTRVHSYYPFLWVWHRLDPERWKCSSVSMRTGRKRTSKLEVDHTVADAWWRRQVNRLVAEKQADFKGSQEEREALAPGDFQSTSDAVRFINLLGNCSLLDKSFNISKSDKPMWEFLAEVHEFKKGTIARADWERALGLSSGLTNPDDDNFSGIVSAIRERDALIRAEVNEFLTGLRKRVD